MAKALVERHDGEVPATMDGARRAAGRRTEDRERGASATPSAQPGLPGRSPRAARRQPNRHRRIRRSGDASSSSSPRRSSPRRWTRTSDTLILHGRRICRPKPLCDALRAFSDDCDYFQTAAVQVREAEPAARRAPSRSNERRLVRREQFERHVADALASIPRRFRDAMRTSPSSSRTSRHPQLLDEMEIEPPDTLLGLYQGTPADRARMGTTATRCPIGC